MDMLLVDESINYTYSQLIEDVSNRSFYYNAYKTKSLYDYFLNFVVALVNNKPLMLIDSDTQICEIDGLCEHDINASLDICNQKRISFETLSDSILNSMSEITIFTSGTTGQPKKVTHTVQSLTRFVKVADNFKSHVWAFAYSPTHMAGLQVLFQALCNKNMLVNVFSKQRSVIYDAIDKYSITHISATPTFYRLLLPAELRYESVHRVTFGGEKSSQTLYDQVEKIFPNAKINNIYASTEAGSLFTSHGDCFRLPDNLLEKFKVVDSELLIHKSLLGKSDSFVIDDDYYHSGDLIEWVDEVNGLFRIKSRVNELINVGGYKVNPNEIETLLLSIDGVSQCLVFGKPNSILGNVLCADVIKDDTNDIDELYIRRYLADKLQDFKIPRRIKFVNELKLTKTGKIKR